MPIDIYTNTNLVNVTGGVSITKDVKDGVAGTLYVAGQASMVGGLAVSGSLTGVSITAASVLTAATGLTVTAGGEVITAGGLSITAGGETITAGGLSITAGGATITGGLTTDLLQGGSTSTIATVADSGTIAISRRVAKVSGAAGATIAGAAIATSGAVGGQELIVLNENTTVGSTIVISTNVILKAGTTSVTVSGLAGARFIYDEVQTKWVNV